MTLGVVDLSYLTDEERERILDVVRRDDQLRESEQKRIRSLKDEVKTLRLKGTIREGRNATRACARCREPFGLIFNTGSVCPKCQNRVCKKCQAAIPSGNWICVFCFRQMEYEAKSGNWFYSKFPRSMRDRSTNEIISGGKIVQDSITNSADELDYASGLEPSQADVGRPRLSDGDCRTAVSADFITEMPHSSASQRTSSNSPQTSVPPAEDGKVSWTADCEGSEVLTQEQSDGMPQSETAQDASMELDFKHGLDVDSRSVEELGTSQAEDDGEGSTTAGESGVKSLDPSCQLEDDHDVADRVAVAENLHSRLSSELESLNFSVNSGGLSRDIADDDFSAGACNSDRQSDESRRLCGVYDSNDSAFEDDVDCQAHLGSGNGEILEGSCEDLPVSFTPDLGTFLGNSNDRTSEVIGKHIDKTDPLNSGVSCDGGTISDEAPTLVAPSLVDEAGYFPLPYCNGTEDVSVHFIADSKDSEPYDVESPHTHLSVSDGTCDYDVCESVPIGSVACLSNFVSDGLPSIDLESSVLRPVENCEESENKILACDKYGDLDKPGCNLDGYDKEELFLAVETCNSGDLEFAGGKEELSCRNVFQVPDISSVASENVSLLEVLERNQPAMDWNLEFSGVNDSALSEEKQSPVSNGHLPDHELHEIPPVTPVLTLPEVICVMPSLHGNNLEKSETDSNGSVCVSASAGNGASVRSKVGALLAKYSHRLESEKFLEDGIRTNLGMSYDVTSMRSNGVGHDTVIKSKPGFYPRSASSPVLNHKAFASDFDDSFEGGLLNGRSRRLSTSAYAVDVPDIAGPSSQILKTKDFDRQTDDAVTGMNSDFSEEEFGSDSPWDSDNFAGRVPAEDDSDSGDMEWDGIDLCKTMQGAPHCDNRSAEISDEFNCQTNDLSALRSMLSSCLSDSGFHNASRSPPRSPSPTEGCEIPPEHSQNVEHGRMPKRGYLGASGARSGVKEDDLLSVISEHTEPESDGDDS